MIASEKLTQLINNNKLTDGQLDNLSDWGICQVSELKDYLIDKIKELQNETDSIDYEESVTALSDLLDYGDDDYVVYDEGGVQELDDDTLADALDVD